jgi:hypothetical protein
MRLAIAAYYFKRNPETRRRRPPFDFSPALLTAAKASTFEAVALLLEAFARFRKCAHYLPWSHAIAASRISSYFGIWSGFGG